MKRLSHWLFGVLLAALILAPSFLSSQVPTLQRALPEAEAPDTAAAPVPIGDWVVVTPGYDPQTMRNKTYMLFVRFDVGGTFRAILKTQTEDEEEIGSSGLLTGRWTYGESFGQRLVCVERTGFGIASCPYTVLESGAFVFGTQRLIRLPRHATQESAPELSD